MLFCTIKSLHLKQRQPNFKKNMLIVFDIACPNETTYVFKLFDFYS